MMNAAHVSQPANQPGNQRNAVLITAVDWPHNSVSLISQRAVRIPSTRLKRQREAAWRLLKNRQP